MKKWVVHCKRSDYDVYIGRPDKWGNPFIVGVHGTRGYCVDQHIKWIDRMIKGPNGEVPPSKAEIKAELKGKRLGCWCSDDQRCHGDYLATIANRNLAKGLFG